MATLSVDTITYPEFDMVTQIGATDLIAVRQDYGGVALEFADFKSALGWTPHVDNETDKLHITAAERTSWNAKAPSTLASSSNNGLMSSTHFNRLASCEDDANYYTHPTHTNYASGFYKITVDNEGSIIDANAVVKQDIVDLGIPAQNTTYSVATTSVDGLESKTDKTRIDDYYTKFSSINNAGMHNSFYRGKNLGNTVTAAQWAAIKAGTFDDMYIGDYWDIGEAIYRIAAFDYYYGTGDTECTKHHVTVVPDAPLDTQQMEATNTTANGYAGSAMRSPVDASGKIQGNLEGAIAIVKNAFGAAHILKYRDYLTTASSSGHASAGSWFDCEVELMTEAQVYGTNHHRASSDGTDYFHNYTVAKSILPLFRHESSRLTEKREHFWLRDICTSALFAYVNYSGNCLLTSASGALGVRPCFNLYQA